MKKLKLVFCEGYYVVIDPVSFKVIDVSASNRIDLYPHDIGSYLAMKVYFQDDLCGLKGLYNVEGWVPLDYNRFKLGTLSYIDIVDDESEVTHVATEDDKLFT